MGKDSIGVRKGYHQPLVEEGDKWTMLPLRTTADAQGEGCTTKGGRRSNKHATHHCNYCHVKFNFKIPYATYTLASICASSL